MNRLLSTTLLLAAIAAPAGAKISLPKFITDNMLVQRNSVLRLSGNAAPGSKVSVEAGWEKNARSAQASDNGSFSVEIPTPEAGGPWSITITDKDDKVRIGNVLSGELWLCSGQSNMEFPVQGWTSVMDADHVVSTSRNPDIRLLQVRKSTSFSPMDDVEVNMGGWVEAAPNTMDFSAIAYLYARELRDSLGIPVGVIDATWGGTPAEAWTSFGGLKDVPGFGEELSTLERNGFAADRMRKDYERKIDVWMKLADDKTPAVDPSAIFKGTSLPVGYFENIGFGAGFDGVIWAQKEFDVPAGLAGQPLRLSLGAIDDEDITYLNGVEVARGKGYNTARVYTVPTALVKTGKNLLTVRISDFGGEGGFAGPASEMKAEIGGTVIPLDGNWNYKVAVDFASLPKKPVSVDGSSYPTVLYNAMIHPLRDMPVKGVLWYQGCANVGRAEQYEPLFKSLISDWRETWGSELPFYFVQLAGYLTPKHVQPDSEWAALRNAQSKALELGNTAMVSAIDLGDPGDIHPRDKQSIAHRLAMTALSRDYGMPIDWQAPVCTGMKIIGDRAVLTFDRDIKPTSSAILGFIIGDKNGNFDQASAVLVDNRTIELRSSGINNPVAVRYDWADYPDGNLYGSNGIPLAPFASDK